MSDRIKQLETSLLELGTEMFRLKHQLSSVMDQSKSFVTAMKDLKLILDEKGLITQDDFDAAVDMNESLKSTARTDADEEMAQKLHKKASH